MDELPHLIQEFCERNNISFDSSLKYNMHVLDDNKKCYSHCGILDERENGVRIAGIDKSINLYSIAGKTEDELIKDIKFMWKTAFIVGLVILIMGLGAIGVDIANYLHILNF